MNFGTLDGKQYKVDLGGTFVHGCDERGENLVYNLFKSRKIPLVQKYDTADQWYLGDGSYIVPSHLVDSAYEFYELLDKELLALAIRRRMDKSPDIDLKLAFEVVFKRIEHNYMKHKKEQMNSLVKNIITNSK